MKRWILGLVASVGMLVGVQSVDADWIPKINHNGTVDFWFDPIDPMPPPPPPNFPWIMRGYDGVWYAFPSPQ